MSMIGDLTDRMEQHLYCLKKQCDNGFDYEDEISMTKEAITTIKDLSAKLSTANMERSGMYYNGGWIPLEEYDLPKENGLYEVTAYWHETWQTLQAEYIDNHWWVITRMGQLKDIPVIAWRYLVEPYKPKENK